MSGDVQPRRRKDKKRRKDETGELPPQTFATPPPQPPQASIVTEDVNIHVHHEGGTGGGICAKIIFFLLFSALITVIGLIIIEHRGLTELDTVDSESRYSQIFEGWIDNTQDHDHDDHIIDKSLDEIDDHDDHDDDHDDDEQANHDDHDEEHDEVDEEEEDGHSEADDDDDQDLSEEKPNDDEDDEEEPALTDEDNDNEENEDQSIEQSEEIAEGDADEDEDNQSAEETAEDDIDSDEHKVDELDEVDDSPEDVKEAADELLASKEVDTHSDEQADVPTKVEDGDADDDDKKEEAEGENQESSSMAVKLGVGVALLVVAHVVLIRKWKSAPQNVSNNEEATGPTPDMSRRNTIVSPPPLQEVEPDLEQDEEDYSDDGEVELDDEPVEPKSAKAKYQELRSTYTRSFTPENEKGYQNKPDYEEEEEEYEDEDVEEEEEEDEDESENEEYEDDEDEDEDLLKRLEAKYGKIEQRGGNRNIAVDEEDDDEQLSSWKRINVRPDNQAVESDSDNQSDNGGYDYATITNKDDHQIKEKLDEGQQAVENNPAYAFTLFDAILKRFPSSPRSLYGKALALDNLADKKRSNELLNQAINTYIQLLNEKDVPDALMTIAAEKCIKRMRFIGQYKRAIEVHKILMSRFPNDPKYSNDLAVTYLTINRVYEARGVLKETLAKWPNDGFALVHFGFVLKTVDNNLVSAVEYMTKGLATKAPGVIDGRFYFHLGDALARLGKRDDAMAVYEEGVKNKLFPSKYQRSLYNVPRLKAKPWWEKHELPYQNLFKSLEDNWREIRREGLSILNTKGHFQDESENLRDTGDWKQFELFARGHKNVANCKKCPITCKIIENSPDASGCKRGQTKFSVMHPGTHVWSHCGPTNCRLRMHLGLKVPPKTFIRVAEETRCWKESQLLIFDDSFEHEVWHNGSDFRLVLIIDIWHPELTPTEKRSLSPI